MAHRALISQSLQFFLDEKSEFLRSNELMGHNDDEKVYDSSSIWTFQNLVTHKGMAKQAPELMMQSLAAIFILRCLKAKKYYPSDLASNDPLDLSETELYLSKLIHHFMRVTYFNTHEITTTDEDTTGIGFGSDRLAMRRIGRATNPTLALLNHSCDPNYRRISVGRQVQSIKIGNWSKQFFLQTLGFATKHIKAGEEITDTYCPTFAAIPKSERGVSLSKYNFECNCVPCQEDWPTLDQLPRKFHGLPQECYKIESKEKVVVVCR